MDNKQIRLYNVGFSPIFFYLFPPLFLISIPFNFVVDSVVLLLLLKKSHTDVREKYKKCIWKIFTIGYLADIAGALVVILTALLADSLYQCGYRKIADIINYVSMNAFYNPVTFVIECLIVAFSGWLIYYLNLKFSFKKTDMDDKTKKKISKWIAIFTAPYLFFVPMLF